MSSLCKHYNVPVTCSVCGGSGMAWEGSGCTWLDSFRHTNPAVCAAEIEERRKELDRREAALKEQGA